ncbi:MAG: hypothetical protein ACI35Q_08500 [Marinilabiliaceae bacterium]
MITIEKAIAKVIASQAEAIINDSEDIPAWDVLMRTKQFNDQWQIALEGKLDEFVKRSASCPIKNFLEMLDKTMGEMRKIIQSARDGSMNPSLLRIAFGHIVFHGFEDYGDTIENVAKIILIDSMSENERLEFIDDEDATQICQ